MTPISNKSIVTQEIRTNIHDKTIHSNKILSLVFCYLDTQGIRTATVVCRNWKNIILKNITATKPPKTKQIPSIIASYIEKPKTQQMLGSISLSVSSAWDQIWDQAPADQFIDSLLCNKTIDFRGDFTGPVAMRKFSQHIYPLLVEMATAPLERAFLSKLAKDLRLKHSFLMIIPKETSSFLDENSCIIACHQGIPLCLINSLKGVSIETLLHKTDSFMVELRINNPTVELLEANDGSWHLGSVSLRSILAHELGHIAQKIKRDLDLDTQLHNDVSFRWTHGEEARNIAEENRFLQARGEMTRLSHKWFKTSAAFKELDATSLLIDSLMMGMDGSVKALCNQDINTEDLEILQIYVDSFLDDFPPERAMLSSIDETFRSIARIHKNTAMELLVMTLLNSSSEVKHQAALLLICLMIRHAHKHQGTDIWPLINKILLILPMPSLQSVKNHGS